jgi:hypothetical protein
MTELIVAVLVVIWVLAMVTSTTMSGLIHVVLVVAIVIGG